MRTARYALLLRGFFFAAWWLTSPHALALRHVWNETLPGIHVDQGDVVRVPNVSQQVSYYVVIRDVATVVLAPRRYVPSHVHAAEWDDVNERYAKELTAISLRTLPSDNSRAAIRLVVGGWIGAGMLNENGRIDSSNSFMPQTLPMKIKWSFEKAIPSELKKYATQGTTVDLDIPQAKVHDRTLIVIPFSLDPGIPAQTSTMTMTINGHELKPMEVRFSGKPLQLPEYTLDPSDKGR